MMIGNMGCPIPLWTHIYFPEILPLHIWMGREFSSHDPLQATKGAHSGRFDYSFLAIEIGMGINQGAQCPF